MRSLDTKTIEINHRRVEFFVCGSNEPAVVFINGFRMQLSNWSRVIDDLVKKDSAVKLVSFNRPSIGKSSKATTNQHGNAVVNDMENTLTAIGITGPVILVAHSLGGIFANLYARQYPENVAGVIFVDAPAPEEILEHKKQRVPVFLSILNDGLKYFEKIFNPYKFSEDEEINTTIEQLNEAKPFPHIPITIITGTKKMPFVPESAMELHQKYQKELLALSPLSQHIHANSSGHFPQIDEPELVSEAIRDMITTLKEGQS